MNWLYEEHLTTTPDRGPFGIRSIMEYAQGKFWFSNTRYRYNIITCKFDRNTTPLIRYERENGITGLATTECNDHIYFLSIVEDDEGDLDTMGRNSRYLGCERL